LDPVIWFKNVMLHSDLFIYLFAVVHFIKRCSVLIFFKSKLESGITVLIKVVKQHSGCNLMDKF